MQITDLFTSRTEVVEGCFQGSLQAHKVGSSADLVWDPIFRDLGREEILDDVEAT